MIRDENHQQPAPWMTVLRGHRILTGMSLAPDDEIHSREELAAFVRALHQDFLRQGDTWENNTLATFLEALATWVQASPGFYRNVGKELPAGGDWTFIARALQAATVYE
ncbi:DUF7660 family protein [Streptomyces sp. NPDC055025]